MQADRNFRQGKRGMQQGEKYQTGRVQSKMVICTNKALKIPVIQYVSKVEEKTREEWKLTEGTFGRGS
jgi:hypothetical protein